MNIDYEAIGRRIRTRRIQKAMTQEQLAALIEREPAYLSCIEHGNQKPSLDTLLRKYSAVMSDVNMVAVQNMIPSAKRLLTRRNKAAIIQTNNKFCRRRLMNIDWNAKGYQKDFAFVPKYGEAVLDLIDAVPGALAVDLGCGNGGLTGKLIERGYRVVGVDASAPMLALAKERYPDTTFLQADACTFHLPMLRVGRYNPQPEYLFVKRLLDIVISAIALVILSPIFLVTAIAIKATDHGPVFYKQIRLTKDGKKFGILKFRSMRVDAEKDGVARLSSGENDDRITPVGKIIRACRVDELPQLINILKGDLSIVGPRPERPEIAAQYCEEMPEFSLRLQAKAGLTGYAQVYGKYNTTPYDKLTMDLMYIAHPSIVEDLKIMFATVKILFMPESTEGVSEGQTTAMSGENN